MSNTKINDLAAASSVSGTMQIEVDTGGTTSEKVTVSQILTYITSTRPQLISIVSSTNVTLTNQVLADAFMTTSVSSVCGDFDLSLFTQMRLTSNVVTVGTATSKIGVRYYTSFSNTFSDYLPIGESDTDISVSMAAQGLPQSSWTNLTSGAKASSIFLCAYTTGGDGVADPIIFRLQCEFR
jgi:hypothetical protein